MAGRGSSPPPCSTLVVARQLVLPGGNILNNAFMLITQDGRIASVTTELPTAKVTRVLEGDLVVPGFIDIHTHGLGGTESVLDYWTSDYTTSVMPSKGTTSLLASVTFPVDEPQATRRTIESLRSKVGLVRPGQAVIEGIHGEGPLVASLGAMGKTQTEWTDSEFEDFIKSMLPGLRIMTISPAVEAKHEYRRLRLLLKHRILPALGHDLICTEAEMLGALRAAAEVAPDRPVHLTHLFNVMKFHHRDIGLTNIGLCSRWPNLPLYADIPEPTIELVGDLLHVHPVPLLTALSAKRHSHIAFITDSIMDCEAHLHQHSADKDGKPHKPRTPGSVSYGKAQLEVSPDKRVCLKGTSTLAGSCVSQLDIYRNLVTVLGVAKGDAACMLSEAPARIAGLSHLGRLEPNRRADFLILSNDLQLDTTVIAGQIAFSRAAHL